MSGNLNCCLVHKNKQQNLFSCSLTLQRGQPSHSLVKTLTLRYSARGLVSLPTPAQHVTPLVTPEQERVHPLFRSCLPEPKLCLEVSPSTSTSHKSSGSLPTCEVPFHIPRVSLCHLELAWTGAHPYLPPSIHSTQS